MRGFVLKLVTLIFFAAFGVLTLVSISDQNVSSAVSIAEKELPRYELNTSSVFQFNDRGEIDTVIESDEVFYYSRDDVRYQQLSVQQGFNADSRWSLSSPSGRTISKNVIRMSDGVVLAGNHGKVKDISVRMESADINIEKNTATSLTPVVMTSSLGTFKAGSFFMSTESSTVTLDNGINVIYR